MRKLSQQMMVAAAVVGSLGAAGPAGAQTGAKGGEWRTYGGDLGNTRYAPLDQINATNFNNLEVAWSAS
jgi:glucose dehydrogenase